MIEKKIEITDIGEFKFEQEFKKYRKIVIASDGNIVCIRNYRQFLEQFSLNSNNAIKELEDFFVSFIRCIGIMKEIDIKIINDKNKLTLNQNTENIKYICFNNLQSIINVIVELGIATILKVF